MENLLSRRRTFIPLVCGALLFASGESFSQSELHDVELTTIVKTKGGKTDKTTEFEQQANKAITTITQGQRYTYTLTATLYNSGDQQGEMQLEWYFLSNNTKGKSKKGKREVPVRGVFEIGKTTVSVEAGTTLIKTIESKPLVFTKTTRNIFNENTAISDTVIKEIGDIYVGYLVLVTVDGKIIAKQASSYRYLKEEWVEKCRTYKPKKKGKGR